MNKVVIAGGTGFLGSLLVNHFKVTNAEIRILSRSHFPDQGNVKYYQWNGKEQGEWSQALEGADVLINLNGKSVDCRYTEKNKQLIYSTRLDSTAALGRAIQSCQKPPELWINAASATIYRHSLDKEMDEKGGEIGSGFSVDVCRKWEQVFDSFEVPGTRKILIRTGIVLGKKGGPFFPLKMLAKTGLGGMQGPGNQYFSWLHEKDFVRIIRYFIENKNAEGIYNLCAPSPVQNKELMKNLRKEVGVPFGLPLPEWLLEIGAGMINTETELILKSRRVIPKRLLEEGYRFEFTDIKKALVNLIKK